MAGEVEVVSKEFVIPSSPTPHHLRHHHQSFLDQLTPHVYNPMVFFFDRPSDQPDTTANHVSNSLKKSLSEILTHYYPLAGRFIQEGFLECNDEGVLFVEARASCQLSDFTKITVQTELNKLVPYEYDALADLPLRVQLTSFDCGGVAVGAAINHRIGDALSFFTFVNNWAAVSRSHINQEAEPPAVNVEFLSATLFPAQDMSWFDPNFVITTEEQIITKRFVFDATSIEALKTKYGGAIGSMESSSKPPSRIEALSAFIWSRCVALTQSDQSPETDQPLHHVVTHTVNLRPRMEPPLPEYTFGNCYAAAVTFLAPLQKGEDHSCSLIKQVREAINKMDKEYVKVLQVQGNEMAHHIKENTKRYFGENICRFNFTSLCRFPLYDADFGWGRPMWVGAPARKFSNTVSFVDASKGGGIEAYISLAVEAMAKLENDKEFLEHVTPLQSNGDGVV